MVNLLIAFLLGSVVNFLTWSVLNHIFVPDIRFSSSINKREREPTKDDASKFGYRIKLENNGRRSVIDVEVTARLRINYPPDVLPNTWTLINIPLEKTGDYRYHITRLARTRTGEPLTHTLRLLINEISDFRDISVYPASIRAKAKKRALLLEDILSLGEDASLQVTAFGYDEFSGARKLFLSKHYTLADIKEDGTFEQQALQIEAGKP
ncbi:MAG: hypothetical protein ACXWNQ_09085 [Anaerolineales bacterium]